MIGTSSSIQTPFTYLDNAGAILPPTEMLASICNSLMTCRYANPHSSGSSRLSDDTAHMIDRSRGMVLDFLGASPSEYDVVFTSGSTAALHLLGQVFPWGEQSTVCYPFNCHTSLLGIRDFAPRAICFPSAALQHSLHSIEMIDSTGDTTNSPKELLFNLLLVPGECNLSGVKADLTTAGLLARLIGDRRVLDLVGGRYVDGRTELSSCSPEPLAISDNGLPWMWALDAAKLVADSRVDLSALSAPLRPHFLSLSFYKIFGYPTGLGALVVRRDVGHLLRKRYHGGGTVYAAAVDTRFLVSKQVDSRTPHAFLEDGTIDYYGIAALSVGFEYVQTSLGGISAVEDYTFQLTCHLVRCMVSLVHRCLDGQSVGVSLCTIYGRHLEAMVSSKMQGPVIAFSLRWADGSPIGFAEVGRLASERSIYLRTGCFCNPGGCQELLGLTTDDVRHNYRLGRICSDDGFDVVNNRHTGLVRVSLGFSNTRQDCDRFVEFLEQEFLNRHPRPVCNVEGVCAATDEAKTRSDLVGSIDELCLHQEMKMHLGGSVAALHAGSERHQSTREENSSSSYPLSKPITIAAIFVYPIKSCAGIRVDAWPLCSTGFLYDRMWVLVDAKTNKVITQKQHPQLALVQPAVDLEGRTMTLRAPQCRDVLVISLQQDDEEKELSSVCVGRTDDCYEHGPSMHKTAYGRTCDETEVSICGCIRKGVSLSFEANEWFSRCLSVDPLGGQRSQQHNNLTCILVRSIHYQPTNNSNTDISRIDCGATGSADRSTACIDESQGPAAVVDIISSIEDSTSSSNTTTISSHDLSASFVNSAQFLLLSVESVRSLNQVMHTHRMLQPAHPRTHPQIIISQDSRLEGKIKIENFRPNIVVSGGSRQPHQEDQWRTVCFEITVTQQTLCAAVGEEGVHERVSEESIHPSSLVMTVDGPCARCSMVNINGSTGSIDSRVLSVLSAYRKQGVAINFGQFLSMPVCSGRAIAALSAVNRMAWLRVGDCMSADPTESMA